MATATYFLRTNHCDSCNRYDSRIIGYDVHGAIFRFVGYTDKRDVILETVDDWLEWIQKSNGRIYDELNNPISLNEFKAVINCKKAGGEFRFDGNPRVLRNELQEARDVAVSTGNENIQRYLGDRKKFWHDHAGYPFTLYGERI